MANICIDEIALGIAYTRALGVISPERVAMYAVRRRQYIASLIAAVLLACAGCEPRGGTAHRAGTTSESAAVPGERGRRNAQRDEALNAALEYAHKVRNSGGPKSQQLPNAVAGPGVVRPLQQNFYEVFEQYPGYLLCRYDISEDPYEESKEQDRFADAIQQVRSLGSDKFPAFRWIAVIIFNRAEHNGAETFERAHKAGAIFERQEVFDTTRQLRGLVLDAEIDRHPFVYDADRGKSWETTKHQRWVLVERHAANGR